MEKKLIITINPETQQIKMVSEGEVSSIEALGVLRYLEKKFWMDMIRYDVDMQKAEQETPPDTDHPNNEQGH